MMLMHFYSQHFINHIQNAPKVQSITFQTEKAKVMSGTLSRVSSSSINTAKDQKEEAS